MSEMLDYFDSKMNFLGQEDRKIVHQKGLWHQTFHCWIIREDNNEQYVVVQIRDAKKETAPNKIDITAAGHLKHGETKEDGFRELHEELGIDALEKNAVYLGIRVTASESSNRINKEFGHVYLLKDNRPLSDYKLQEEEVSGVLQIKVKDGLALFSDEKSLIHATGYRIIDGKNVMFETNVSKNDFIYRIDNYYYKIFIMAERVFNNNSYVAI